MARYKVAPTKTNLIKLKREYLFAQEGYDLLEQKREILIAELLAIMERAERTRQAADEALQKAFNSLLQAVVKMGKKSVSDASEAIDIRSELSISQRRVMGVMLPIIETKIEDKPPYYSLGGTSFWLDETIVNFKEVLKILGKLAETQISVFNLTQEVKKTVRRVNALEKIALPDYKETLKYIVDVLEEAERETFFTLKLIKNRLEKRRQLRLNAIG